MCRCSLFSVYNEEHLSKQLSFFIDLKENTVQKSFIEGTCNLTEIVPLIFPISFGDSTIPFCAQPFLFCRRAGSPIKFKDGFEKLISLRPTFPRVVSSKNCRPISSPKSRHVNHDTVNGKSLKRRPSSFTLNRNLY